MVMYLAPKMLKISRLTLLLLEPREEKQAQVVVDRRSPDRGRAASSTPPLAGSRPRSPLRADRGQAAHLRAALGRIQAGRAPLRRH